MQCSAVLGAVLPARATRLDCQSDLCRSGPVSSNDKDGRDGRDGLFLGPLASIQCHRLKLARAAIYLDIGFTCLRRIASCRSAGLPSKIVCTSIHSLEESNAQGGRRCCSAVAAWDHHIYGPFTYCDSVRINYSLHSLYIGPVRLSTAF